MIQPRKQHEIFSQKKKKKNLFLYIYSQALVCEDMEEQYFSIWIYDCKKKKKRMQDLTVASLKKATKTLRNSHFNQPRPPYLLQALRPEYVCIKPKPSPHNNPSPSDILVEVEISIKGLRYGISHANTGLLNSHLCNFDPQATISDILLPINMKTIFKNPHFTSVKFILFYVQFYELQPCNHH